MKIFFSAFLVFSAAVAAAAGNPSGLTEARLSFLSDSFGRKLSEAGASRGALCVVSGGKTVFGRDFALSVQGQGRAVKNFPLGNTSQALLSLMLLSMQSDNLLAPDWKVARHCSYFRFGSGGATFADLLSMRAGFDPHCDSLVPGDASSLELFEIAGQLTPSAPQPGNFPRSRLSASIAGYAMGYVFDKKRKNMKKSFAACAKKYLFDPLGFSEPRFSSFDKAMFPATAFALSIADCSKWLECETSRNPPVSSASEIAARRVPVGSGKFAGGWMSSREKGIGFFVTADYWEGCANVVAVSPSENVAAAFFVCSRDPKKASKLCADALSGFFDMLANPK